jgi:hypothetical protein
MRYLFLLLSFIALHAYAVDVNTYIPLGAITYKLTVQEEIERNYPKLVEYNYVPALIEHESCISLTHKRCWNPTSQLKTSRETGAGLGQITIAYREDGSVRFDKLKELRDTYRSELKDLTWDNVYKSPGLQIRALVLLLKQDNNRLRGIEDEEERLNFTDAAYNGGIGGVFKEQRACGLALNCNSQIWFGNVEKYCMKSNKALYGTRSACDINRAHTRNVMLEKLPKYKHYYALTPNYDSQ